MIQEVRALWQVATKSVSNSNLQKSSNSKFFCLQSKGQNELMESSLCHIINNEYTRLHGLCPRSTCMDYVQEALAEYHKTRSTDAWASTKERDAEAEPLSI